MAASEAIPARSRVRALRASNAAHKDIDLLPLRSVIADTDSCRRAA